MRLAGFADLADFAAAPGVAARAALADGAFAAWVRSRRVVARGLAVEPVSEPLELVLDRRQPLGYLGAVATAWRARAVQAVDAVLDALEPHARPSAGAGSAVRCRPPTGG